MKKLILSITAVTGFSVAGFAQGVITLDGSNNSNPSPSAPSSGLVWLIDYNNNNNGGIPGGHVPGYDCIDTFYDINVELLYSSTRNGTFSPVVTLLRSGDNLGNGSSAIGQVLSAAGDITSFANGKLFDISGQSYVIPGIAAGQTAYFELLAWTGNFDSYSAANNWVQFDPQTGRTFQQYRGASPIFSEVLSDNVSPSLANIENMPALILNDGLDVNGVVLDNSAVPEPSPLTMAGIGIGSMLMFGGKSLIRRK